MKFIKKFINHWYEKLICNCLLVKSLIVYTYVPTPVGLSYQQCWWWKWALARPYNPTLKHFPHNFLYFPFLEMRVTAWSHGRGSSSLNKGIRWSCGWDGGYPRDSPNASLNSWSNCCIGRSILGWEGVPTMWKSHRINPLVFDLMVLLSLSSPIIFQLDADSSCSLQGSPSRLNCIERLAKSTKFNPRVLNQWALRTASHPPKSNK